MELLYIWIEDYKNIKRQGFNFSAKYRFEFTDLQISKDENDKEIVTGGTLKELPENPNYIEKFFDKEGNITNVTAIVGENGSGKSSVLEVIKMFLIRTIKQNNVNIAIFKFGNKQVGYANKHYENKLKYDLHKVKFIFFEEIDDSNNVLSGLFKKSAIFYSNVFDDVSTLNHRFNETQLDISFSKRYHDFLDSPKNMQGTHKIMSFRFLEIKLQLHFISTLNPNFDFIPSNIRWRFDEFLKQKNRNLINPNVKKIIKEITDEKYTNKGIGDRISYSEKSIVNYLEKIILSLFADKRENLQNNYDSNLSIEEKVKFFLEENGMDTKPIYELYELIDKITQVQDYSNLINIEQYSDELIKIFEIINDNPFLNIFSFEWYNLSSGENAFLNIFAQFFSIQKELNKQCSNLIMLIDEGELGLHPQWQKKYLQNILTVLPQIFKDKKLQFILTSHSPFLVSDLPKENVIFLEKDKKTGLCKVSDLKSHAQTFGQNIHTLFADSFFMDKNGGLMGEFAKEKLQKVIDFINGIPNEVVADDKTAQKYIDLIGEPILQRQLQKKLYEKQIKNLAKSQKIELLEKLLAQEKDDSN